MRYPATGMPAHFRCITNVVPSSRLRPRRQCVATLASRQLVISVASAAASSSVSGTLMGSMYPPSLLDLQLDDEPSHRPVVPDVPATAPAGHLRGQPVDVLLSGHRLAIQRSV